MPSVADDYLDEVQRHIREAIDKLSQIVVHECDGYSRFDIDFQEFLQQTLNDLIMIRRKLK